MFFADKLCQLLDQSVSHLKASSSSSTNQDLNSLTPRITGGWLLGVQSNNLDIAILSSTGQDFATRFLSYMRDQQRLKREGQSENQETRSQPSRPGPIRANILKLPPLPSLAWNSTLPNSEARNTAIRIVASQAHLTKNELKASEVWPSQWARLTCLQVVSQIGRPIAAGLSSRCGQIDLWAFDFRLGFDGNMSTWAVGPTFCQRIA
ncbi:CCA tRNA nucleotidyltransferase, mitochondrial [Puccinia graminis f. sp. tritici]|uniref:CCA tRNA nucleotidyltransferase, mitochondrial n=1 Tax=Puccinia graminis f. sp. tritici TaxID=56615 RepID=A0A5B0SGI8_PUCGR|nr:CCA tRNA nucleotidyltransferase, mitochondrial [Puccinia graminis f. sp. tritici]